MTFTQQTFNRLFDHTILKPSATQADIRQVCEQAARYGFHAVAVNTGRVELCAALLKGSGVAVDAAVGFPLGITTIAGKCAEAAEAIEHGAGEVDYVVHIGKVKDGDYAYIRREMEALTGLCRQAGVLSKVIFENCYLTDEEKRMLCRLAAEVRPDYIKTSTGFGPSAATVDDVRLMKAASGGLVRVKAAGGIRDLAACLAMLEAGADRIGCSNSVALADAFANR